MKAMDLPITASGIGPRSVSYMHFTIGNDPNTFEMVPTPSGIRWIVPSGVALNMHFSQSNYFMGNDVLAEAIPAFGVRNVLGLKPNEKIPLYVGEDRISIHQDANNSLDFTNRFLFVQFLERVYSMPGQNTKKLLDRLEYNENTFHAHKKQFNAWAQKMTKVKKVLSNKDGSGYRVHEAVDLIFLKWY